MWYLDVMLQIWQAVLMGQWGYGSWNIHSPSPYWVPRGTFLTLVCYVTDLTGSSDGSVRLWEWEHSQPLTVLRAPGNFPKVTKVLFNAQGNKVIFSYPFFPCNNPPITDTWQDLLSSHELFLSSLSFKHWFNYEILWVILFSGSIKQ